MALSDVAIFSDVHGNLQALQAVLADIESHGIKEVVCLGDIVGYGGHPAECVALVRGSGCRVVMGNHDFMVSREDHPLRSEMIRWTKRQLSPEQDAWLGSLPYALQTELYDAAHASLWVPAEWEYLLTSSHADLHFQVQRRTVSFVGHTHQPRIWIEGEMRSIEPIGSEDLRKGRRHIVNVGSVGQPRDENPRACYVVFSPEKQLVRRLDYDIAAAQAAIIAASIPARFAHRLEHGK